MTFRFKRKAGLGGGHEHAHALAVDDHAALVLLNNDALHHGAVGAGLNDAVPVFGGVQALLGEHDGALHVVDAHDIGLDLVAHMDDVRHIDAGLVGEL